MPPHRRSSPPVLTPPILIILLPIVTFLFLLFALPPFLTFTSHIFRPIAVKKSWDLLNIFLVLFAILCGVFARRNDDESPNNDVDSDVVPDVSRAGGGGEESEPVNPQRWFGYSDDRRSDRIFDSVSRTPENGGLRRLRRSSSSYPDLRQESLWETRDEQRFQFRFFDDFDINKYRATASLDHQPREARARRREGDDGEAKEIPVDTFVVRPTPPPKSPSPSPATPPPPPPPPPAQRQKPRRTYRTVGERKEKVEEQDDQHNDVDHFVKVRSPPPTPPPPPPRLPPSPAGIRPEQKKLERRKINVKKEIAMAFTSLYNQRKRKKKQKIGSSGDHDSPTSSPPEQTRFPPPSPPPPPPPLPPPPSSVFHNLFKKGSKIKRIHTVPPPPPPPPPPPISSSSPPPSSRSSKHKNRSMPPPVPPTPPPISSSSSSRPSKRKNRSTPPPAPPTPPPISSSMSKHKNRSTTPPAPPTPPPPPAPERSRRASTPTSGGRPPLPARSVNYFEENVNSGSQSPLIPMPPPPPPPPFKMKGLNFVVRGDYVRLRSAQSSRCSSPERDDGDRSSTKVGSETVNVMDGGDGVVAGAVTCPSPDVNIKADTFIARLYDGWRLEKINSLREKQRI